MEEARATGDLKQARVLLVDDEELTLRATHRLLSWAGYEHVDSTRDPTRVPLLFTELRPDLLVLDLNMPGVDGFGVMRNLSGVVRGESWVPILVVTADTTPEARQRALAAGARDFLTKPWEPTEALLRIRNLLEARLLHRRLRDHSRELEDKVRERTRELAEAQAEILHRLAVAAEYRDDLTGQHAERVGVLAAVIARRLGRPAEEVDLIRLAAPLHDVGKIGIPDAILLKNGPLSPAEFEVMKAHTSIGARILSGGRFPLLQVARVIALSHHERWDGGGYRGLKGDEIPLTGRIVAVADAFDSLIHDRPYKTAVSAVEAVSRIRGERGGHFDPRVVDAFLEVVVGGELEGTGVVGEAPRADVAMDVAERQLRRRGASAGWSGAATG